jgi:hypothetical protein
MWLSSCRIFDDTVPDGASDFAVVTQPVSSRLKFFRELISMGYLRRIVRAPHV